jgi:hypothetical protein
MARRINEQSPSLAERRDVAVIGAQYSATLERWIGFLYDGNYTTNFDPRTNRERALQDARDHWKRIFEPEVALKKWVRP